MTNEKSKINKALAALILAYIASLGRAAHTLSISETYFALKELNEARVKAGLRPVKIDFKKLKAQNDKIVEEYQQLLNKKKGSYVVVNDESNGTEVLVFKSWLLDLKDNTKKKMLDAFKLSGDPSQLKLELDKIKDFSIDVRAKNAAFVETRTFQHQIKMNTWKEGRLQKVQRIAAGGHPCHICQGLDGEIFDIDDCPPLSHVSCLCIYIPWYDPTINSDNIVEEDIMED